LKGIAHDSIALGFWFDWFDGFDVERINSFFHGVEGHEDGCMVWAGFTLSAYGLPTVATGTADQVEAAGLEVQDLVFTAIH
jgi:hypothetical protein